MRLARLAISSVTIVTIILTAYLFVVYWIKLQYESTISRPNAKILLIWEGGFGEQETIERLKITCKRLGIELHAISINPNTYFKKFVSAEVRNRDLHAKWNYWLNFEELKNYYFNLAIANFEPFVNFLLKNYIAVSIKIYKPDFLLTIQDQANYYPGVPNYMTFTMDIQRYVRPNADGSFSLVRSEYANFDALLPSFTAIDQLKHAYEATGKSFNGFTWYPTVYTTEYQVAQPQYLFYSGGTLWDGTRASSKYKQLFSKLDQTGYFRVCGVVDKWQHTPNSAIGLIPIDGKSLIAAIHKAGISLVLHTQGHIESGAPTARIFEAAAANAVIIADRHPFIQQNFGNNVLYIDTEKSAENIFQQIDQHMQWIYAHPKEAQAKAINCHDIFMQKFSLDAQLLKLLEMHQHITQVI